jgi:hypothetical protein
MRLDGAFGHEETTGDRFVGKPLRDEAQDF